MAQNPELEAKGKILEILRRGEMTLQGQFVLGYNFTFLVQVTDRSATYQAVYKPQRGEQPLWDFPENSLSQRELAAWLVGESLGWDLVPPTVIREDGPLGAGSLQLFIEHDPLLHYFNFSEPVKQSLRPAVLFDLLVNNADRKGGHLILDQRGKVWLIDHGLCFHEQVKLRTVIWDFAGEPFPPELISDLGVFLHQLSDQAGIYSSLLNCLSQSETDALAERCNHLISEGIYPFPPTDRRAFPFPPI